MSIIRDFTLYLNAGVTVPPVVHVNQYDQGEVWRFTLLEEDGSQYTPSSGALIGVKSDGHAIAGVTGTVLGDGRVSITETQQMTAASGKAVFELTIDGGSHGTANFIVQVEPKPTDSAILSDSDLSIIQEGINSVTPVVIADTVSDWLEDNLTDPPIDPTLSISNAAADAKVTGDKITELKTKIDDIYTKTLLNGYDATDLYSTDGYWSNSDGEFVANNDFCACNKYADIKPNTEYSLWYGDGTAGLYCYVCFYDSAKNFISGSNMPSTNIITSPANGEYVRISVQKEKTNYVFKEGTVYDGYNTYGYNLTLKNDINVPGLSDVIKELSAFEYTASESLGYLTSNGTVDTTQTNFKSLTTNKIPCSAGDVFEYTGRGQWGAESWVTFRGDTVIGYGQSTVTTEVTIASGIDGIIFSSFEPIDNGDAEVILIVKRLNPQSLADKVNENSSDIDILKNGGSALTGLKIDIIGDSWSAVNDTASVKYTNLLQNNDGMNVNVLAYSGSGYSKPTSANKPFYVQALNVRIDSDIVFIFGSFNDVSEIIDGVTIGEVTDTGTSTICGCINTTIDNIVSRNPSAKIIIGTAGAWQGYNANNDNNNPNNAIALQYIEAIKNVCFKRGYPCIDYLRTMNLKPWIASFRTAYQPDGTHPNNAGHLKYVYPRIKRTLIDYV